MIAAVAVLAAMQAVSASSAADIQAALAAKKEGKWEVAIAALRRVVAAEPNLWAAHSSLGETCYLARDFACAASALARSLELKPDQTGIEATLGLALIELGRSREGIARLESARAKRPGDSELLFQIGRAYARLARQAFDEIGERHAGSARALQLRAEALAASGRADLAEREYREAIRLGPQLSGLHAALGELYYGSGDFERASAELAIERGREPGDARSAHLLGAALLRLGRASDALVHLAEAARMRPGDAAVLFELGKAQEEAGRVDGARQTWLRALDALPGDELAAGIHHRLALLHRRRGEAAEADDHQRRFESLRKRRPVP